MQLEPEEKTKSRSDIKQSSGKKPEQTQTAEEAMIHALREIATLERRPFAFPADWSEQIAACSECQGWAKHHPIQQGICNTHRKPIYQRDAHEAFEEKAIGYRAMIIASDTLRALGIKPEKTQDHSVPIDGE
jgi:hypothetical protein